ncbi:HSP20-like chaperone [Bimuria novae-zelandiae CBS 107.79]|uniref:HSP20-like chaperone n=1 Tax=Bimuria novae-zelandiae CBS 107.79 TaxID=1447943 RepID=A0A6A5VGS2_9PLEO|nr:HSP20-like chaperone [Bimuria novae-zelandiae CBS 107.79]
MAFFLTPQFAPAYTAQQCNPWACAPRPQPSYRRVVRPSFSPFAPFLNEVDELISALDHEARREAARREAHRQRQQRKRIVRALFNVHENQEGYQVDAELPYFKQEHIEIEVTDGNTLRLSGNTERKAEQQSQPGEATADAQPTESTTDVQVTEAMDGVTLNEPAKSTASGVATPTESDTESQKSYQATVEDDFEDLGAETASTFSAHSESEAPKEPKGKEKAVEEPAATETTTETAVQQQPQPEAPAQQSDEEQWEFQGSFERTFRFPERIDAANVRASFRNGLLSITIPKAKAPEARRIQIQ